LTRSGGCAAVIAVLGAVAAPACAQSTGGAGAVVAGGSDLTAQLNRQSGFAAAIVAPPVQVERENDLSLWAATERTVWTETADGGRERLRLRTRGTLKREDGSPLPPGPLDRAAVSAEDMDVTLTREGRPAVLASGGDVAVTLTPHVGLGVGSRGGSAEAGATLKIGPDLDRLVPEGREAFGERSRWYLFAAGTGRAVGYNFARNRDGEYARSGYSTDGGVYLGDASLGVAWRKGDLQTSVGVVYRELDPGALVHPGNLGENVSEGILAFSLSIKPEN